MLFCSPLHVHFNAKKNLSLKITFTVPLNPYLKVCAVYIKLTPRRNLPVLRVLCAEGRDEGVHQGLSYKGLVQQNATWLTQTIQVFTFIILDSCRHFYQYNEGEFSIYCLISNKLF